MYIDSSVLAEMAGCGLTMRQIAEQLNAPYIRVRRAFAYFCNGIPVAGDVPEPRPPLRAIVDIRVERVKAMAAAGLTRVEMMRELCIARPTLKKLERIAGVDLPPAWPVGLQDQKRAERMALMFRQGVTLSKIGDNYGLTRERVRQIMRKLGVLPTEGGRRLSHKAKVEQQKRSVEARCLLKYGFTRDQMAEHRRNGLLSAFRSQRGAAKARGIGWSLSFAQWLQVWLASGKLDQRGRGKGKFCMSRIKDAGGYVVGNVHIQLATENSLEAVKQWLGKSKAVRGVFHTYPGLSTPYVAKVGKHVVGMFATEGEAVTARLEYIAANGYAMKADGTVYPLPDATARASV